MLIHEAFTTTARLKELIEATGYFTNILQSENNVDAMGPEGALLISVIDTGSYGVYNWYDGNDDTMAKILVGRGALDILTDIWVSDYGIWFERNHPDTPHTCILTKNNQDKLMCIISPNAEQATENNRNLTNIYAATGNQADYIIGTPYFTNLVNIGATILCPFCTKGDALNPAYSPNAFFLPISQTGLVSTNLVEINGEKYISNGLWALKV